MKFVCCFARVQYDCDYDSMMLEKGQVRIRFHKVGKGTVKNFDLQFHNLEKGLLLYCLQFHEVGKVTVDLIYDSICWKRNDCGLVDISSKEEIRKERNVIE